MNQVSVTYDECVTLLGKFQDARVPLCARAALIVLSEMREAAEKMVKREHMTLTPDLMLYGSFTRDEGMCIMRQVVEKKPRNVILTVKEKKVLLTRTWARALLSQ